MKDLVVVLVDENQCKTIEVNHNDLAEVLCLDMRNGMSMMSTNAAAEAYHKMTKATPDKLDSAFNKDLWTATIINLLSRYRQSLRSKFPRMNWIKEAEANMTSLGYGEWVREQVRKSKVDIVIVEEGLKGL